VGELSTKVAPAAPDRLQVNPPESTDDPRFIRWLFVDLWNAAGKAYIKALSDTWLRGQQPSP